MLDDILLMIVGIFLIFALFFIINDGLNSRPNEILPKRRKKKKKEDNTNGNDTDNRNT